MSSRRRTRRQSRQSPSDSDWSENTPKSKNTAARRRSTRARKRPDSYVPATVSPKRKRTTPKKQNKKVSPPVNSTRESAAREVSPRMESSDSDSDEDEGGDERTFMFSLFKDTNSDAALAQTARDWIAEYKVSQEKSMLKILGLILYSCVGDEMDLDDIVATLDSTDFEIDDLSEKLCDLDPKCFYPILEAGKSKSKYRNFQSRLHEFWQRLVAACHSDGLLYESQILEMSLDWLTAISGLQVPSFRHTCMDSAFHICKLLITYCKKLHENLKVDRERLNTALRHKRKGQRMKTLKANIAKFRQQLDILEEHIKTVVTGIFVHRQKDVQYSIRAAAIEGLSDFVCQYPAYFLDEDDDRDTCINWSKYLGQHLRDEHASVRLQAVRGVKKLLMSQKDVSALEMYLDRNQDRIVSMSQDVDTRVTIEVLELCGCILEKDQKRFTDAEIAQLDSIIFRETLTLQRAAAKFIRRHVSDLGMSVAPKRQLKALASFCSKLNEDDDYENLEFCDSVVAGFFETTESLRHWDVVSDLILKDSKGKNKLSDEEQAILVRFLLKSMNIVTEKMNNKRTSKRNKATFAESQKHFSDCMVTQLPRLLDKYSAEDSVVQSLILMPQFMSLDRFNPATNKKKLKNLLKMTIAIFKRGTSKTLLEATVKTLQYLCTAEHDRQDECVAVLDQLVQDLSSELEKLIDADAGDDDAEENLRVWLLRLFTLGGSFDMLDKLSIAENLFDFAMERSDFASLPEESDPQIMILLSNFFYSQIANRFVRLASAINPEDEYESQDDYDKAVGLELDPLLDRVEAYYKLANKGLAADMSEDTEDDSAMEAALNAVKLSLTTNVIELQFFSLQFIECRGMQKLKDVIWTHDPELQKQMANTLSYAVVNAQPEEDVEGAVSVRAKIVTPLAQLLSRKLDSKLLPVFLGFLGAFKDLDAEELGKIVAKAAFKGTKADVEAYFKAQETVLTHLYRKTVAMPAGEEQDESFYDFLVVAKSCSTMGMPIFKTLPPRISTSMLQLIESTVSFAFQASPKNLAFLDAIEYYTKWFKSRAQKNELAKVVHAKVKEFNMVEQYAKVDEDEDGDVDAWQAYSSFLYGESDSKGGIFTGTKYESIAAASTNSPVSGASPMSTSSGSKKTSGRASKMSSGKKKSKSRVKQFTPSTALDASSSDDDDDFMQADDTLELELDDFGFDEQELLSPEKPSPQTARTRKSSKRRRNSQRTPVTTPGEWLEKKKSRS